MKAINLNFTEILIKLLIIIYTILAVVGAGAFLAWYFNGNAVLIEDSIVISSLPMKSALEFKHILVFGIPIIIESTIVIYILVKLMKVIKRFKNGFVFDKSIASELKQIATLSVILILIKTFLAFTLNMIFLKESQIGFNSSFLVELLLVSLIFIIADMVDKGAQLKAENELTI